MRTRKGFTLVEILISLAVLAIVLSSAIPAFARMLQSHRLHTTTQALHGSLMMTRHEAIKRGQALTLAAQADDWNNGWLMFIDANHNGRYDPGEELLRSFPPTPGEVSVAGNAPVSRYVRYTPDGRATLINGGYQMGTLKSCLSSHPRSTELVINQAGRVRLSSSREPCD